MGNERVAKKEAKDLNRIKIILRLIKIIVGLNEM